MLSDWYDTKKDDFQMEQWENSDINLEKSIRALTIMMGMSELSWD